MHCMQAERDGMATKLAHADSEGVETEVFISLSVCLFDGLCLNIGGHRVVYFVCTSRLRMTS